MTDDHEKIEERAEQSSSDLQADQQIDTDSDDLEGIDDVQYRRSVPIILVTLPLLVLVIGLLYSPSEGSEIFTHPTPEPPPSTAPGIFRPATRQQATVALEGSGVELVTDQIEIAPEEPDESAQTVVSEGSGADLVHPGETTRQTEPELEPEPDIAP